MKPAAIVFDAYGTLFDVHSVVDCAESFFPGQGVALSRLWRERQIDYSRLRTLSARYRPFSTVSRDSLRYALARLQLPDPTGAAERGLMDAYLQLRPFAENVAVLDALARAKVPLAILSNGDPPMLEAVVRHAAMQDYFTHLLSADTVQRFKTAPEVYQLAESAFDAPAHDMVFVSSNGWDACGATWYGFRTYWVNRQGEPAEELGVTPAGSGPDMRGLLQFVDLSE